MNLNIIKSEVLQQ